MSTKYVHFTDEQKEEARQTDLCELLRSQGEKLKRSGSEYEWQDGSQKVTIRGNLWFHQYDQQGGDAIDFVRRFYNKDYPEAVEYLLGGAGGTLTVSPPIERTPPKPFELPLRNNNMRRVYAYLLSHRGLDRDVVYTFAHRQMIYESVQYHNAVFVGFDQEGVPRHANMRGTGSESTFKGNAASSIPEYSFHWTGRSKYLLLFEAPIDMLSFISMHKKNWQQHPYTVAENGNRKVQYANKAELMDGIVKKYHPEALLEGDITGEGGEMAEPKQTEAKNHQPPKGTRNRSRQPKPLLQILAERTMHQSEACWNLYCRSYFCPSSVLEEYVRNKALDYK